MIRSRRSAHRWIMSALALVLPPITLMALLKRPEIPAVASAAEPLFADAGLIGITPGARVLAQFQVSLEGADLSFELARDQAGYLQISASPRGALNLADPLLYWRPLHASTQQQLTSAQLLGSIAGAGTHRFMLPDTAQVAFKSGMPGQLLIVSPLAQQTLAVIKIPVGQLQGGKP